MKNFYSKTLLILSSYLFISHAQAISGPIRHIYNALDVPITYKITVHEGTSATISCPNASNFIPAHTICSLTAEGVKDREFFYFDANVQFTWGSNISGTYRLDGYSSGGAQLEWKNGGTSLGSCGPIIFNHYPSTPNYDKQPFKIGATKGDIIFWENNVQPRCSI
ncbi:hypothetical protein [Aquella oligotrophica]|uniref:Uncharacterized protein n=1 Tax=Aquella oligotrophica TaxID=2067065 RepID=A0A2I7N6N7_9NEIS|nr:hypothetical protein [Aquella oligotrophica]AUR51885.1 hypothetical protein CUN60_06100 [Aquella oligotrophica]